MTEIFKIFTTVDITPTGVINTNDKNCKDYDLKRNQQRNYDTLSQVISLRSNIYNPQVTCQTMTNNPAVFHNPNLPEMFECWIFEFQTDRAGVFGENNEALYNDLHMVPIVPALTETIPQFPPYFISYGELGNIIIRQQEF